MPKTRDVGVIVGRFQVHQLHEAHLKLLTQVYTTHAKMIVVLGLSAARVTADNPLDFEARKQMLLTAFPKATVLYIKDHRDDTQWSIQLDNIISDVTSPTQEICLYGGRDSFISHYHGSFPVEVLEPDVYVSGTELRKTISKNVKGSEDFRAGVIWAAANGYPRPFTTVDIAVYRDSVVTTNPKEGVHEAHREWLLVRKPTEKFWRFPGGFVQSGETYETAAQRELREETSVAIDPASIQYVKSFVVDDWRYRREVEKITTILFTAPYQFGPVKPADDVSEAQWAAGDDIARGLVPIIEEHQPLRRALKDGGVL